MRASDVATDADLEQRQICATSSVPDPRGEAHINPGGSGRFHEALGLFGAMHLDLVPARPS